MKVDCAACAHAQIHAWKGRYWDMNLEDVYVKAWLLKDKSSKTEFVWILVDTDSYPMLDGWIVTNPDTDELQMGEYISFPRKFIMQHITKGYTLEDGEREFHQTCDHP